MWNKNYKWHFDYARLAVDAGFVFDTVKQQNAMHKGKLSLADVEAIIREKDVATLECYIPMITSFKLDEEHSQILDPSFLKLFRLSQLSLDYLVFCKAYLDNSVVVLKKEMTKTVQENKDLKSYINELKIEVNELRKDLNVASFKCEQCSKLFATEEYLSAHIRRRHEVQITPYQEETNKLQLEIKQLKERLNSTEKIVHLDEKGSQDNLDNSKVSELQHKFEILKVHVENELKLMQTQKNFQGKYERWFEDAFSKIHAMSSDSGGLKVQQDDLGCHRRDSMTQTDTVVKNVVTRDVGVSPCRFYEENVAKDAVKGDIDVDKIKREITNETHEQIGKVEGVLEEMVANSLEKMETRMQTLLSQIHRPHSPINTLNIEEQTDEHIHYIKRPKSSRVQNVKLSKAVVPVMPPFNVQKHRKPVVEEIISSSTATEESSSELTEEDSEIEKIDIKPSTTSTLGQRSITSLRNAAASKALLKQFRNSVEHVVDAKLEDLGISSSCNGLSKQQLKHALDVVNREATLAKKKYPNYNSVRKKILALLDEAVKAKKPVSQKIEKKNKIQQKRFTFFSKNSSTEHEPELVATKIKSQNENLTTEPKMFPTVLDSSDSEPDLPVPKPRLKTNVFIERAPQTITKGVESNTTVDSKKSFASVVQELKKMTEQSDSEQSEEIKVVESPKVAKSALKTEPAISRKKVLFNLDGKGDKSVGLDPKIVDAGSTTSVPSSVFDAPQGSLDVAKINPKEGGRNQHPDSDLSDWEISEILN